MKQTQSREGVNAQTSHSTSRKFVSLCPVDTTALTTQCMPWRLSFLGTVRLICQTLSVLSKCRCTLNKTEHIGSIICQKWISCVELALRFSHTLHWLFTCLTQSLLRTLHNWAKCKCIFSRTFFPRLEALTWLRPHKFIVFCWCSLSFIRG